MSVHEKLLNALSDLDPEGTHVVEQHGPLVVLRETDDGDILWPEVRFIRRDDGSLLVIREEPGGVGHHEVRLFNKGGEVSAAEWGLTL